MKKSILVAGALGLCALMLPTEALAHSRGYHHHHRPHRTVHRDPGPRFFISFGAPEPPPYGYERCVYKPWKNKTVCTNYWH